MSPGNIIVLSGVIALVLWGTTGIVHGTKWLWHNRGCVISHGVKACKAQTAAKKAKVAVPAQSPCWINPQGVTMCPSTPNLRVGAPEER